MENREEKIERVLKSRQEGIVVLQDIHDPHNAAAVWRSADAMGWQKIYLIFENEKYFNPKKTGRVSSGSANKWLDFKVFRSTTECFDDLKEQGFKIVATVLDAEAKDVCSVDFQSQKKVAIVMGNEHRGLTEEAIRLADEKVYIPMKGMVQSLNLSVTAGIVLHEVSRQRNSNPDKFLNTDGYELDVAEKEGIRKRWR